MDIIKLYYLRALNKVRNIGCDPCLGKDLSLDLIPCTRSIPVIADRTKNLSVFVFIPP